MGTETSSGLLGHKLGPAQGDGADLNPAGPGGGRDKKHPRGDPGVRERPPPPQREERGLCPRGDNGDIDGDPPAPRCPRRTPPWQKETTPPAGTPPPLHPAPRWEKGVGDTKGKLGNQGGCGGF